MEMPMMPIIDYGGIAIVIPKVSALGGTVEEKDHFGFEVFLTGSADPVFVAFATEEEADEARDELLGMVARYYYVRDLGPDFDENLLPGPEDWKGNH